MFILKGRYGYGELKKRNRIVRGINILDITGQSTTQFHAASYRADNENLGIFGVTYPHGTVFALRQSLYQNEATGMERLKM